MIVIVMNISLSGYWFKMSGGWVVYSSGSDR